MNYRAVAGKLDRHRQKRRLAQQHDHQPHPIWPRQKGLSNFRQLGAWRKGKGGDRDRQCHQNQKIQSSYHASPAFHTFVVFLGDRYRRAYDLVRTAEGNLSDFRVATRTENLTERQSIKMTIRTIWTERDA